MFARSRALRAVQGAAARHTDGLITRTPPTPRCVKCPALATSFHTSSRFRQGEATGSVPKTATSASSPPLVPASLKRRKAAPRQSAAAVVCRVSAADAALLTIEGPDLSPTEVPAGWLRDRCPQSTSPSSGNKNFATGEIPVDIAIESVRQDSEGHWEITWRNNIPRFVADGINTSVFTSGQLRGALQTEFASRHLALLQHHTIPTASTWNRTRRLHPREVSRASSRATFLPKTPTPPPRPYPQPPPASWWAALPKSAARADEARGRTRFAAWHAAASTFQHMLEEDGNMIRRRLREGDCVVFDNRRVLHGRTAFDPSSGGRHLRGAYVGIDEWRSTIKRVERNYAVSEFLEARKQALRAWSESQ
ncbi:predicted protein [Verticillium alfalfae VaMs.102]|uniref:Predicted protein n=1 Tax=Verticillium alfalfae (strain VaMs.102 / ATCC MYA-4576 / FGSC 10136) TaxID=526221 RepID=C9SRW6_VERA1|nr:predicted protein [Verticillium alfalfae VaMs.102]EEY21531.1 predicted protein [Verticillium alfalfae VaMs.102]